MRDKPSCIVPIVEGHADKVAVPHLLRRIIWEQLPPDFASLQVAQSIIVDGSRLMGYEPGKPYSTAVEGAIRVAANRAGRGGLVLVVTDSDGKCPKAIAPLMEARFQAIAPDTTVALVLMHPEFEEIFKYSRSELAGKHGLSDDLAELRLVTADEVDSTNASAGRPVRRPVTEAKGWLNESLPEGYRETLHQPKLTGLISLEKTRACASMDKLCRVIETFAKRGRQD